MEMDQFMATEDLFLLIQNVHQKLQTKDMTNVWDPHFTAWVVVAVNLSLQSCQTSSKHIHMLINLEKQLQIK